ncbi:MAG: DMT family transporter [Rhizobiaceae bacterium]
MELWIPITIIAAFLQNVRSAMQKHLKGVMGDTGATFVRFGFGLPVAAFYWLVLVKGFGFAIPAFTPNFWFWVVIAALAQIGGTFLLVSLFSFRNFVVGTAYSRTEAMQTAFLALVLFGASFTLGTIIAIIISVVGVMIISVARTKITPLTLITSLTTKTALIGILSGTFFAVAAVGFRQATLSLVSDQFFMQACTTLLIGIAFQTAIMFLYMLAFDRQEISNIARAWKPAAIVGLVGASATFGWFSAFALQQAAVVKVLGQVEILFTFTASYFIFKERMNLLEMLGCAMIVGGILVLLLIG